MVAALLDTSIIVDFLRLHQPAAEWIADQEEAYGVTLYVWLEVIQGCQNKVKQKQAAKLLNSFELIQVTADDVAWAVTALTNHNLQFGVDILDCLIASTSSRTQLPLYTQNIKHFKPLLGELAQSPY